MENKTVKYLEREEITDDIIIIKLNKSYRPGMSSEELYDITRGCWKRRMESVERAKYALAVYKGEVIEVYLHGILHWKKSKLSI